MLSSARTESPISANSFLLLTFQSRECLFTDVCALAPGQKLETFVDDQGDEEYQSIGRSITYQILCDPIRSGKRGLCEISAPKLDRFRFFDRISSRRPVGLELFVLKLSLTLISSAKFLDLLYAARRSVRRCL